MMIENVLTVEPISNIGSNICPTLIINVDKKSRRPSRRQRQSTKLATLIFNLIKVEDI